MRIAHSAPAPPRRVLLSIVASLILGSLSGPFGLARPASAAEIERRPLAVVIVGPVGSPTATNVQEGRRMSTLLKSYGARVREVYSPNATWSRVTTAARGANLLVYLGAGRGYPGPAGRLDPLLPAPLSDAGSARSGGAL